MCAFQAAPNTLLLKPASRSWRPFDKTQACDVGVLQLWAECMLAYDSLKSIQVKLYICLPNKLSWLREAQGPLQLAPPWSQAHATSAMPPILSRLSTILLQCPPAAQAATSQTPNVDKGLTVTLLLEQAAPDLQNADVGRLWVGPAQRDCTAAGGGARSVLHQPQVPGGQGGCEPAAEAPAASCLR